MRHFGGWFLFIILIICLFVWLGPSDNSKEKLRILIPKDSISDSFIKEFENRTAIHVETLLYESDEEMLDIMNYNNVDLILFRNQVYNILKNNDFLLHLDFNKIENIRNIDSKDIIDNYSIPFFADALAIIYNSKKVSGYYSKYIDVLNNKVRSKIVLPDNKLLTFNIVIKGIGGDLTNINDKMLDEASKLLSSLNNVEYRNINSEDLNSDTIVIGYVSDALKIKNEDTIIIYPKDGYIIEKNYLGIMRKSKRVNNAMVFINYLLDGERSADILDYNNSISISKISKYFLGDNYKYSDQVLDFGSFITYDYRKKDLMTKLWFDINK